MQNLIGKRGHVTLDRPIRAIGPGSEGASVRIVAFDGELTGVDDGIASFNLEAYAPHPDDVVKKTKTHAGLDMYVPPGEIVIIHCKVDNLSGFQELNGYEAGGAPGVVGNEHFPRADRLRFAALASSRAADRGEAMGKVLRAAVGERMNAQRQSDFVADLVERLHDRLLHLELSIQALSDTSFIPPRD